MTCACGRRTLRRKQCAACAADWRRAYQRRRYDMKLVAEIDARLARFKAERRRAA